MKLLKQWLTAASPAQKQRVAKLMGWRSTNMLSQLVVGRRVMSPEAATRLEHVLAMVKVDGAPVLRREHLSPVCGKCAYARACREAK